tara:strand:- start:436 stop:756 length:321 start_codon:yes stop_codon:yes gene_type:complete
MTLLIKPTKIEAVKALAANATFSFNYDTDKITFNKLNGDLEPSESAINAKYTELLNAYNAEKYKRDRAVAYPSLQEQLDLQYWDQVNGTTKWKEAIAKVKSDNPKP